MPSVEPISKSKTGYPDYLDFRRLRELGLKHIQDYSGNLWTDHNLHDPGITILEELCFALLDLGYRTGFSIPDLLASDKNSPANPVKQFFSAAEILSNNPLTETDYRKLLLDIRGVRNAWLHKADRAEVDLLLDCASGALKTAAASDLVSDLGCGCIPSGNADNAGIPVRLNGLYRVLLELEPIRPEDTQRKSTDQPSVDRILSEARARLAAHRNLCEDFLDIQILQDEQIAICAHIEIAPDYDPEDVLVDMYERLRKALSPTVPFYTLSQLLKKGRPIEDIFEGRPLLPDSHGFVDTEELEQLELPTELHASDFYRIILDENPGILAVRKLLLFNYIDGQPQTSGSDWCLHLTPGYHPVLAPELCKITLFKDGVPFTARQQEVLERFQDLLSSAQKNLLKPYDLDLPVPEGIYRNTGDYWSIQHDFPAVYGIGEGGIPESAPPNRKAQALQLKAFLLFFDQLLSNYLAQLAHLRDFFALEPTPDSPHSYFPGNVSSVPDLAMLIRGGDFEQKGEPITGSAALYRRGEVVVFPFDGQATVGVYSGYQFFNNPRQRDDVIRSTQAAFENELFSILAVEDDCGLFRFEIRIPMDLPNGGKMLILQSKPAFKDPGFAEREGEALTFLGLSGDHYRILDHPAETAYSFELIYEPRPYAQILEQLSETPQTAFARRDKFLNHLLARFAEDFTDYALLQIDNTGKRRPLEHLITDKENFLADYPDISRNRGRGFDYTAIGQLWDTDNITGLENRAGALMGIDPRTRHTLAPFEVFEAQDSSVYRLFDFRCRPLWVSQKYFASFDAFNAAISELAADCKNYRRVGCGDSSRYSFVLVENAGTPQECIVAIHPDTYSTPEQRDAKMGYFAGPPGGPGQPCSGKPTGIFTALDAKHQPGAGVFVKIVPTEEGYVFSVQKPDSEGLPKVLLQSVHAYKQYPDAQAVWAEFADLALEEKNYTILDDPYGKGYGIAVLSEEKVALAIHPVFYKSEAEAQAVVHEILDWIIAHRPDTELTEEPAPWIWEWIDGNGQVLLESLYGFTTRQQAAAALNNALELAGEAANWEKAVGSADKHTFFLQQTFPAAADQPAYSIRVARHPAVYDNPAVRDAALATTRVDTDPESFFYRHLIAKNRAYLPQWCTPDGQVLLEGTIICLDKTAAQAEFDAMLQSAKNKALFVYDEAETQLVWLNNEQGQTIAQSTIPFLTAAAAQDFIGQLAKTDKDAPPVFKTRQIDKAYTFALTDAGGKKILTGNHWYSDLAAARIAFLETLFFARNPEGFGEVTKKTGIGVQLLDAEGFGLASSDPIEDPVDRAALLEALRQYYASDSIMPRLLACPGPWNFTIFKDSQPVLLSAHNASSEKEAAVALETTLLAAADLAHYQPIQASDGCWFSFEITGDQASQVLANHPLWYPSEPERDSAMAGLAAWFQEHTLPANLVWQDPKYNYELWWESCDEHIVPVLISPADYGTEELALQGFETMQQHFLNQGPGTTPTDKLKQFTMTRKFSFCYAEGDDRAVDPHWYEEEKQRNNRQLNLSVGIYDGVVKFQYIQKDQRWHYEACWPPCDATGIPALIGQTAYASQEEAQEAVNQLKKRIASLQSQAATNPTAIENAFQRTEGMFSFALANGAAQHPETYDQSDDMLLVMRQLVNYMSLVNWADQVTEPCANIVGCGDPLAPVDDDTGDSTASRSLVKVPNGKEFPLTPLQYGFRLRKAQGEVATYTQVFSSAVKRNTALCELQHKMACQLPEFSTIDCDSGTVAASGNRYVYRIKSGNNVWWISADTFATKEEAWAAFEANYLTILEQASYLANYQTACQDGVACYFWLPAPGFLDKPIARTPDFLPGTDLVAEFEKRERHARTYPVFQNKQGGFCFRIADPKNNNPVWISGQAYPSDNEALRGFYFFLNLLQYAGNYVPTDDPGNGRFGLVLWEPGLEGVERFSETRDKESGAVLATAAENAWEGLNDCLIAFGDTAAFFTWQDVAGGCRFGFNLANDAYRLARHPRVYHTPAAREAARDDLFHGLQCSGLLAKKCTVDCFWFLLNAGQNCGTTYKRNNVQFKDALKWDLNQGILCIPVSKEDPCYETFKDNLEAEKLIDLMAAARAKECYVPVVEPTQADDPTAPRKLGLLDASFQLIGISKEAYIPGIWEKCRDEAIEQAWQFPFVRQGNGFGVQLAIGETILLESVRDYSTPLAAQEAFCRMLELLRDKNNLVGTEPGACGPFGIELRDPKQIKARHPATYPDCDSALQAAAGLERCLDAEGFHVIEHILLRPRTTEPDRYFVLKSGETILLKGTCPVPPPAFATPDAYAQARMEFLQQVQASAAQEADQFWPYLNKYIPKTNGQTGSVTNTMPLKISEVEKAHSDHPAQLFASLAWNPLTQMYELPAAAEVVALPATSQEYNLAIQYQGVTLAVKNEPFLNSSDDPPTPSDADKIAFIELIQQALNEFLTAQNCLFIEAAFYDAAGCLVAQHADNLDPLTYAQLLIQIIAINDADVDIRPPLLGGKKLALRLKLTGVDPQIIGQFQVLETVARDAVALEAMKAKFLNDITESLHATRDAEAYIHLMMSNNTGQVSELAVSTAQYNLEGALALLTANVTNSQIEQDNAGEHLALLVKDQNGNVLFRSTRLYDKKDLDTQQKKQSIFNDFTANLNSGAQRYLKALKTLKFTTATEGVIALSERDVSIGEILSLAAAITDSTASGQVVLVPDSSHWVPPARCWSVQYGEETLLIGTPQEVDITLGYEASRQAFEEALKASLCHLVDPDCDKPATPKAVRKNLPQKPLPPADPCEQLPLVLSTKDGTLLATSPRIFDENTRLALSNWLYQRLLSKSPLITFKLIDKYTSECTDCTDGPGADVSSPSLVSCVQLLGACVEPAECRADAYIPGADPYSFWATVAVPHWGRRFRNVQFRQFFEKTLRSEAPAHVALRFGWISAFQMVQLEKAWRAWLEATALGDDSCLLEDAQQRLICILQNLRNRYPGANLHDCDLPGDAGGDFVLLDHTILSV